jgi:hypothetical protein
MVRCFPLEISNGDSRFVYCFGFGRTARAKPAQFQPGHPKSKPVAAFDLALQLFKQRILNLKHRTTPLAGEVHVVLVGAGLVVMAVPVHMHQVKLIDDAEFLERFQGAIDGGQVQAGHLLPGAPQDFRGIEVLTGLLEDVCDDPSLAGQAEAMLAELGGDGATFFEVLCENHIQLRTVRN